MIQRRVLVLEIVEAEGTGKGGIATVSPGGGGSGALVEAANLSLEEVAMVVVLTCFSAFPRFHPFAGGRKMT